MSNLSVALRIAKRLMIRRSPELLTGIGVAGVVVTVVLAVKDTPKALKRIEEKKDELEVDELPAIETLKAAWTCYIPTAITGLSSIACIIGASSVNFRRNAALAAAYKLSETALIEYKDKVLEEFGEKKEQVIREKIAEDKLRDNPVKNNEVIITGSGDTLCFDTISGRYFKSSFDKIRKAENELNRVMLRDNYVSLNSLYDELGLGHIDMGDDLGWRIDKGMIDIHLTSHVSDEGSPALVLEYTLAPDYDYYNFY